MNRHDTPAEIEADIHATQARIDQTIDTLKARLTPGELLHQAMGFVKDEGGEIGQNAYRQLKENPIPLALMASAMAWMMMPKRAAPAQPAQHTDWHTAPEHSEHREAISLHDRVESMVGSVTQQAGETMEAFGERLHDARASAMGLSRQVGEEIHSFRDRVGKAVSNLAEKASAGRDRMAEHAGRIADAARNSASQSAGFVKEQAGKVEAKAGEFFTSQPLIVGAIGMVVGALAGALIPNTRRENEMMAGMGKEVRREAGNLAETAIDAVESTATNIAADVSQAAKDEGLTPRTVRDAAGDVIGRAERVVERAIDSVEKETADGLRRMH